MTYIYLEKKRTIIDGVTECLKTENQMDWLRRMNSFRAYVEELVLCEIVYKK